MEKIRKTLGFALAGAVAVLLASSRRRRVTARDHAGRRALFVILGIFVSGSALAFLLLWTARASEEAPRLLLAKYGCSGCHQIGGDPSAVGRVGPSLVGVKDRLYLGGVVRNSPEALTQWIMDPTRFAPATAMPRTGLSEDDARRISAYLYMQ